MIYAYNPSSKEINFKYDKNNISVSYNFANNLVVTRITNKGTELKEENYYIREKGTEDYFTVNILQKVVYLDYNSCGHDSFKIEKDGNYYRMKSNTLTDYYLSCSNNNNIVLSN